MRPTHTRRIIQLKPLEHKLPLLAGRMQQKLAHLPFRTRLHRAATDAHIPILTQRDRRDRLDGRRPAVPRVCVLVDCRGKRGDVELVRCLTRESPGRVDVGEGVNEEVERAGGGGVRGDVEGDFGVFLRAG